MGAARIAVAVAAALAVGCGGRSVVDGPGSCNGDAGVCFSTAYDSLDSSGGGFPKSYFQELAQDAGSTVFSQPTVVLAAARITLVLPDGGNAGDAGGLVDYIDGGTITTVVGSSVTQIAHLPVATDVGIADFIIDAQPNWQNLSGNPIETIFSGNVNVRVDYTLRGF